MFKKSLVAVAVLGAAAFSAYENSYLRERWSQTREHPRFLLGIRNKWLI